MRPEYPPWFTPLRVFIEHFLYENTEACDMQRCGVMCGNDAAFVVVGDRYDGLGYVGLAICGDCQHEVRLTGEETTAYWREKQREWGVR